LKNILWVSPAGFEPATWRITALFQAGYVLKNKASFPTEQAVRKLLYLATVDITKKWTMPLVNWPLILNQLAIRFEDSCPL